MQGTTVSRLSLALIVAGALAACHSSSANTGSTMDPGPVATSSTQDGQRGPGGGGRGGRGGPGGARADEMLFRGITLSTDQQQRIDAIRANYRTQMENMRNQSGGDREAMRGQMRSMMEKQQGEIRAVLSADQQAQFDRNMAEMRSRAGQGRGGQPAPR